MKLLIDGDGCPVVDICEELCSVYNIHGILICDSSHVYALDQMDVYYVDQGKDRADFVLVSKIEESDIVVTGDYGLATLALAKKAIVLHYNGFEFKEDNMLELLTTRYRNQKRGYTSHIRKRVKEQDEAFKKLLANKLKEGLKLHMVQLEKINEDLKEMSKEQMMEELHKFHVEIDEETLVKKLNETYNDLNVSDELFATFDIPKHNGTYPCEFIDEMIPVFASRFCNFPFTHYGIISDELYMISRIRVADIRKVEMYQETFAKLWKMCKHFKIKNYDAFMYEVNDGFDLHGAFMDYLDCCMNLGYQSDKKYFKTVIAFIEKCFSVFTYMNEYMQDSLNYELAKAMVAMKNPKGEKLFIKMLENNPDKTEVLFHYVLAYLDIDERKAKRLSEKYRSLMDPESDSYENLKEIIEEFC